MTQEVPICRDCKHLLGRREAVEAADSWRCVHPDNITSVRTNPVTGAPIRAFKAVSLYDVRGVEGVCQPQGLKFEQYVQPSYTPSAPVSKQRGAMPSADDLLGELGQ